MKDLASHRTIRRRVFAPMVILILALFLGIGIMSTFKSTIQVDDVETYHPASVVYDQPLAGHYEQMPMRHHNLSYDSQRLSPHLQIPQTNVKFGDLAFGEEVEHTFIVQNNGQGILRINQIYTTCDCLSAHLTSSVIPPNRMALLRIQFDPADVIVAGEETIGVRYGIFLESNDPHWPQASLWAEAMLLTDTF